MHNYSSRSTSSSMDNIDNMYPDVYTRIYPHVHYLTSSFNDESMGSPAKEDIDRISEEAMRRSGVAQDPPAGHNMNTMSDITRALVVRDLLDRQDRRRFSSSFFPFFFFPFNDRDGERFRDFFDERNRDRFRDFDRDFDRDAERDRRRNRQ